MYSSEVTGLNKVILVGTVGGKPKVFNFENGSVASFTVTTFDTWNDKHTGIQTPLLPTYATKVKRRSSLSGTRYSSETTHSWWSLVRS